MPQDSSASEEFQTLASTQTGEQIRPETETFVNPSEIGDAPTPSLTSHGSSDATFGDVTESRAAVPPHIAFSRKLASLELITLGDWNRAAKAVGDPTDLPGILRKLEQTPGKWAELGDKSMPALTPFQVQQIQADCAESLLLDHYVLLEQLGSGGMGEVYLAFNRNLRRFEAIKTLRTSGGRPRSATSLERFNREALLLANLQHPHLTTVHHAGRVKGVNYLAMEYIRGETLSSHVMKAIRTGSPLPVRWIVQRIVEVAEALAVAHARNVVHRDIKPNNIMITPDEHAKLLDLGIAKLMQQEESAEEAMNLTGQAAGMGTPDVMPPEQWRDARNVTPATDIYSLGCTLHFALTGQMPFRADSVRAIMMKHETEAAPRLAKMRKDLPDGLQAVVDKMLAKKPAERYANASQLLADLRRFTADAPKVVEVSTPAKTPIWVAACAGAAVVIAAAGWFFKFQNNTSGTPSTQNSAMAVGGSAAQTLPQDPLSNPARGRARAFVEDFRTTHQKFRPAIDVFFDRVNAEAEAAKDEADFEALTRRINQESKPLIRAAVDAWVANYLSEHKSEWPEGEWRNQFQNLLRKQVSFESVSDDFRFDEMTGAASALTDMLTHPFREMHFDRIVKEDDRKEAEAIVEGCRKALEAAAAAQRRPHKFDTQVTVGSKPVPYVDKKGAKFVIVGTSAEPVFVTGFAFAEVPRPGVVAIPTVKLAPNKPTPLYSTNADAPGKDLYAFYTTKEEVWKNPSTLLVELGPLESVFAQPWLARRVLQHVKDGTAYPFASDLKVSSPAGWWHVRFLEQENRW